MGKTKDEKFIVRLYETAKKSGDVFNPVNRYEIGKSLSMNPKGIDIICRLLAQANFITFSEESDIILTDHGKKMVESFFS